MGAWGHLFDENDDAADWLADLAEEPAWDIVGDALALADADYLNGTDAANALAAAEVVVAGLGKPSLRLDLAIVEWAADEPSKAKALRENAILAIGRVREDSELQELWGESDEDSLWLASVNETMARL
jgi:hypothetical protein